MMFLCQLIATGNYPAVACRVVGVSIGLYNLWMDLGAIETSGERREFYENIKKAEAVAEVYAVQKWQQQMDKSYQAPRDFLARRFPKRWSERIEIAVVVRGELDEIMQRLRMSLPMDTYAQVMAALASDELFKAYMEVTEASDDE